MTDKDTNLLHRIERIRRQNAELLQRHLEVEADKKRAAQSKALVNNQVTCNINDMMPAERIAVMQKSELREADQQHETYVARNKHYQHDIRSNFEDSWHGSNSFKEKREEQGLRGRHRNSHQNDRKMRYPGNNSLQSLNRYGYKGREIPKVDLNCDDEEDGDLFSDIQPLEPDTIISGDFIPSESAAVTYKPFEPHGLPQSVPEKPPGQERLLSGVGGKDEERYFSNNTHFHQGSEAPMDNQSDKRFHQKPGLPRSEILVSGSGVGSLVPATSTDDLKFLSTMDFSVPPPVINKQFRELPHIYGSGRLRTSNFSDSSASGFENLQRPPQTQSAPSFHVPPPGVRVPESPSNQYQNVQQPFLINGMMSYIPPTNIREPTSTNLPSHPGVNVAPPCRSATHPTNHRLPDSVHPGYPDRNNSPEQGHVRSYPYAPDSTLQNCHGSVMPEVGYPVSESDGSCPSEANFGGQFSMGLFSINQMAQALDVMGSQEQPTNTPSERYHERVGGSYNVLPLGNTTQQCGVEVAKTKPEELLQKALVVASLNSSLQPSTNPGRNKVLDAEFTNKNNDNGMELLNIILQSSDCDETNNCAQIGSTPLLYNEENNILPGSQGGCRPLLGRGASENSAIRLAPTTDSNQFNAYLASQAEINAHQIIGKMDGCRPVLGRGASSRSVNQIENNKEIDPLTNATQHGTDESNVCRPILGRGSSDQLIAADKIVRTYAISSKGDSMSASSGKNHSEEVNSGASEISRSTKVSSKQKVPPKKKSALQERMEAVRNDSSKRFSRTMFNTGVMHVQYNGPKIDLESMVPTPQPVEAKQPLFSSFEQEEKVSALDIHVARYKALREVGRPYEGNSAPSRKPNSGIPKVSTESSFAFSCMDVREKDKSDQGSNESEISGFVKATNNDQASNAVITHVEPEKRVMELTDKKSQLEEALQKTKNENLLMEQKIMKLRLQKNLQIE